MKKVEPLRGTFSAVADIPGSKSITNRAVLAAALAGGTSTLTGVLDADDTQAMLDCAVALGAKVEHGHGTELQVSGIGDSPAPSPRSLNVRMSGTTARFCVPAAARFGGETTIDGAEQMRARPMGETAAALERLGCEVLGESLPLTVTGPLAGGSLLLGADVSSQFASGLLLAAPGLADGLELTLLGDVVSGSYIDMTVSVMEAFGADVERPETNRFVVPARSGYQPTRFAIEPDASAASYFFAAAAVTGSTVRVRGLGNKSLQGDVGFVHVLEQMGAAVTVTADYIEVTGPSQTPLTGVDIDMSDISDTAQSLAAIAPFASSPTRVRNIGFIRHKETDRIAAVVAELQRMGIEAQETEDGFWVMPGQPQPSLVHTYHDHRMAMSFAVTGLVAPGIAIADPGCVAKTFPGFWDELDRVTQSRAAPVR